MTATHDMSVDARLEALTERVDRLLDRQERVMEAVAEVWPIVSTMARAGTERMGDWEERGYFALGRSSLRLLDRVASSYGADDVDELADSVVAILDTVRNLTGSDVLSLANEATDVLHRAGDLEPVGLFGAARKSSDDDVQRGLAIALEMLRQVGRTSRTLPAKGTKQQRRLARHLAPSGRRTRRAPATKSPGTKSSGATHAAAKAATRTAWSDVSIPGFALDEGGFLANPETWTRDYATAMAAACGIEVLTEDHWTAVETMRTTWAETGASPNVRKLATDSGLGTKAIYQLFRKSPGSTAARIAGVPKPVGCI